MLQNLLNFGNILMPFSRMLPLQGRNMAHHDLNGLLRMPVVMSESRLLPTLHDPQEKKLGIPATESL